MAELIKASVPSAVVNGVDGRKASFEIQVNDQLVYSKLETLAFPDFNAVSNMIKGVSQGETITKIDRQQPIECILC